jgi:hypothetical protein
MGDVFQLWWHFVGPRSAKGQVERVGAIAARCVSVHLSLSISLDSRDHAPGLVAGGTRACRRCTGVPKAGLPTALRRATRPGCHLDLGQAWAC